MDEIDKIIEFVVDTTNKTTGYTEGEFATLICMMMEEYCADKDLDVVEFSANIYASTIKINKMLGKYKKGGTR